LHPDVLVKGGDYTMEGVVGADLVQADGGRVVLVDLIDGRSTTRLIEAIRAAQSPAETVAGGPSEREAAK
jgi:D-beta-D-heptose 7-phosphate kinase/D-beta-D-heptose 1-phosphate adenosyltransferase